MANYMPGGGGLFPSSPIEKNYPLYPTSFLNSLPTHGFDKAVRQKTGKLEQDKSPVPNYGENKVYLCIE
jgi:hypothetical protein